MIQVFTENKDKIGNLKITIPTKSGDEINLILEVLSENSNRAKLLEIVRQRGKIKVPHITIEEHIYSNTDISVEDFDYV